MTKLPVLISENPITGFLILTFVISLISFSLMLIVSGAHTPETTIGLSIWMIAIWSPNIAAIFIWSVKSEIISKIRLSFAVPEFSGWVLLPLIPIVIAGILLMVEVYKGNKIEWSNFELKFLLPIIFVNLVMGPLGEELGWRGFLYPAIKDQYGWVTSALAVGIIWALWHAPLWFLDSPQSKIPYWAFFTNVVLLSVLMSMAYNHSNGSIIVIVLLHLTFNLSLGVVDILETYKPGEFVMASLFLYTPLILILLGVHGVPIR